MIILGIYHSHDACAALYDDYKLLAAVALERPSRKKGDGHRWPAEAVSECLAQAGLKPEDVDVVSLSRTDYPSKYFHKSAFAFGDVGKGDTRDLSRILKRRRLSDPDKVLDIGRYLADHGFANAKPHFYNHHAAHALATLFRTDWDNALLYTSDGGGDLVFYSSRHLVDGQLHDIFGGEADTLAFSWKQRRQDSLGLMYAEVTEALGFQPLRHEGKVLGLAAFGEPRYKDDLMRFWKIDDDGQIRGQRLVREIRSTIQAIAETGPREDVAASAQAVLEELTIEALARQLKRHPSRNLGLSGGVFANVKMTQRIAARFPLNEIFVYPAMSDQGEAEGGVLQFLYERDGHQKWMGQRQKLGNVYFGRNYMQEADSIFREGGATAVASDNVAGTAARLICEGAIIGTYLGACEYGPRALGARSIMASPTDRAINDFLNKRLDRTEFMPFAPVVRAERYKDVFELPDSLAYTSHYMTATCNVVPEWRDKIQAVVHVDGTARPQLVRRSDNPVYYDILEAYEKETGIPVLINTSFNAHEEPIINKPEEALKALMAGRVDYLVTENNVWTKP
ncbi:MAG: hypothetical protein K0U74_14050 [Alphaproteobacteria bacterium]|nr:hypothetical protein [Alphaproteobacteria bacterium]